MPMRRELTILRVACPVLWWPELCGYASWSEDWAKFTDEWSGVLKYFNVREFHFREFADKRLGPTTKGWPYKDWPEEKRDEFLHALATIAGKRTRFALSAFFNVRDYNEVIPEWYKALNLSPYDLCLKLFFEAMIQELENWFHETSKARAGFIFDDTQDLEWKKSILWWHHSVKQLRDKNNRLGSLTFASGLEALPLQAADLLAYRLRQVNETLNTRQPDAAGNIEVTKKSLDTELSPNSKRMIMVYYKKSDLKRTATVLESERLQIEALWQQGRRDTSGVLWKTKSQDQHHEKNS